MTTYKLDETPDVFVAPYEGKKMCYQMIRFKERPNHTIIGDMDLNKDKLIIYGTEIKEAAMFQKLYDSLRLGPNGTVFVNCNGACNIWISKYGFDRLHHNITFDWSPFGVVVPNSVNNILRKELLSTVKGEKIETLTNQLSACRMEKLEKDLELQKLRSQLSLQEFEMGAAKIKFDLFKETRELQHHVSLINNKDNGNLEMELRMVQSQLFNCRMENEDTKRKLQSVQEQVSSLVSELQSTKTELPSLVSQILSQQK